MEQKLRTRYGEGVWDPPSTPTHVYQPRGSLNFILSGFYGGPNYIATIDYIIIID